MDPSRMSPLHEQNFIMRLLRLKDVFVFVHTIRAFTCEDGSILHDYF